jgi:hypothetical protein
MTAATGNSVTTTFASDLFWVGTGMKAMDSINRGEMTFGNVYILGKKFDGRVCSNFFEVWSGVADGGYTC